MGGAEIFSGVPAAVRLGEDVVCDERVVWLGWFAADGADGCGGDDVCAELLAPLCSWGAVVLWADESMVGAVAKDHRRVRGS